MSNMADLGFDDEVVTHAIVRDVKLPNGAGTMALITLDNGHDHTRPSSFGPGGLKELLDVLGTIEYRAEAGELQAVGVTGKPFIFAVGADLSGVPSIQSKEQALAIARLGHAAFHELDKLPIPSFAFVNGVAMGGGLEIALHCDYRTLSLGAGLLALPETFLGLVPGWGGTWLLPNLIGAAEALKVIISNPLAQNRMLKPAQALKMGIFDTLLEPADFLAESLVWAAKVLKGEVTVERPEVERGQAWGDAVAAARAEVESRTHGAAPAPLRAIALVEAARAATKEQGFAAEDEALADLIMSDELRAGLYSFDLTQKRVKRPAGAPDRKLARPVTKIGVVGAGLMASQFAMLMARNLEVPVVMTDLDQERLDKGVGWVHEQVDMQVLGKKLKADRASRIKGLVTGSLDKSSFADADLVIEAVFENMEVKKEVFADCERFIRDDCVLATNTSSLSITEMASGLQHPERVVGIHFFNPVAVMPLVEVVKAEKTDDATLATAFAVGKGLKKSCVLVADRPAFVVNRLLTRFLGEVLAAVDEGTDPATADGSLNSIGLPMSPFTLLELVGPAVAYHVGETLNEAFPDRFASSPTLKAIVEAGVRNLWATDEAGNQVLDQKVTELVHSAQGNKPSTEEQVRDRALKALAEEAGLMLEEGVVLEPQDLDLCMLLGAGWPFFNGGILPYLDRAGYSQQVIGKRFLSPGVASLAARGEHEERSGDDRMFRGDRISTESLPTGHGTPHDD